MCDEQKKKIKTKKAKKGEINKIAEKYGKNTDIEKKKIKNYHRPVINSIFCLLLFIYIQTKKKFFLHIFKPFWPKKMKKKYKKV